MKIIAWIRKKLLDLLRSDMERICEERIAGLKQAQNNLEDRQSDFEDHRMDLEKRVFTVEENTRGNNDAIYGLNLSIEDLQGRTFRVEEKTRKNNECIIKWNEKLADPYEMIDYEDFENHFRGSRELIKERQREYLPYFQGKRKVLDLGSGRGEFLELMKENGIPAVGVDLYEPFVAECNANGMSVSVGDAVQYLEVCERVDGIFAGQIAEHLSIEKLIRLCRLAYQKLEDGGCLIMETPNPMSLAIYTHAFYIDPSHNKPVHPLSLQYYLQKAGFTDTTIVFTENSKLNVKIPELQGNGIENLEEFNLSMKEVANQLFGSQDYAIVAKK